ncbi:LPXTG cell wall anchor domain-containing protein [Evansella tamaricis]|uniref:LPXTG cell wall anchor domain-containing protein n=1 Tax=Evansella tamaricis TaxID=2069301 RepID=A0ABS6J9H0_9BACI|nr:LPXTG cell wall anchor domain-containing protein [Evansella tamaricis]MBU9710215.1 LPXTG cell wall anchor domain-containing protein [Evansella tamaricis]
MKSFRHLLTAFILLVLVFQPFSTIFAAPAEFESQATANNISLGDGAIVGGAFNPEQHTYEWMFPTGTTTLSVTVDAPNATNIIVPLIEGHVPLSTGNPTEFGINNFGDEIRITVSEEGKDPTTYFFEFSFGDPPPVNTDTDQEGDNSLPEQELTDLAPAENSGEVPITSPREITIYIDAKVPPTAQDLREILIADGYENISIFKDEVYNFYYTATVEAKDEPYRAIIDHEEVALTIKKQWIGVDEGTTVEQLLVEKTAAGFTSTFVYDDTFQVIEDSSTVILEGFYYSQENTQTETDEYYIIRFNEESETSDDNTDVEPAPVVKEETTPTKTPEQTEEEEESSTQPTVSNPTIQSESQPKETAQEGHRLPDTSTQAFNLLVLGLLLMSAGAAVMFYKKQKAVRV